MSHERTLRTVGRVLKMAFFKRGFLELPTRGLSINAVQLLVRKAS